MLSPADVHGAEFDNVPAITAQSQSGYLPVYVPVLTALQTGIRNMRDAAYVHEDVMVCVYVCVYVHEDVMVCVCVYAHVFV